MSGDEGPFFSRVVSCGVRPEVLPEGLNHIRDGGLNCSSEKAVSGGVTVVVCPDTVCKSRHDQLSLWGGHVGEEWVADAAAFDEGFVPPECAKLLGLGLGCDPFPGGSDSSIDVAHEEIAGGSFVMCMLCGTCCCGAFVCKRERMAVSERWKSRDRQSAVTFCSPGMCWENSVASCLIRNDARCRARSSCCGLLTGSNVEWCIHPSALLLSVNASMCGWDVLCVSFVIDSMMVMIAAKNSRKFMEAFPWRRSGISHRHAGPWREYPPRPHSHASEHTVEEGRTVQMLLMLMPTVERERIIDFQSLRSFTSHGAM